MTEEDPTALGRPLTNGSPLLTSAEDCPFVAVSPVHTADGKDSGSHVHRSVYIYTNVFSICDVHTVDETFDAYFYVKCSWVEPGRTPGQAVVEDAWQPFLQFMNASSSPELEDVTFCESPWRRGTDGSAVLEWSAKCRCTFREQFELRAFPFDVQMLTIVVSTQMKNTRLLEDKFNNLKSKLRVEYVILPEFRLSGPYFLPRKELALGKYAVLDIQFEAKRRATYYLCNLYVPMFLLTGTLFTIFAVEVEEVSDRLSLSLTVVLASVAYKYILSSDLPHIGYVTLADLYVFGHFVFTVAVVFENALAGWLAADNKESADDLDRLLVWLLVGAFLGGHLLYIGIAFIWAKRGANTNLTRSQQANAPKKISTE